MFTINIPILHSAIQVFRAHSHQSPFSLCRRRPALSLLESRQISCSLGIFIFSWSDHACLGHHSTRPMDRSSFTMAPMVSDFTECCRLNPKIPPPALLQVLSQMEALGIPECTTPCAIWTESMQVPLSPLGEGSECILVYL